MNPTDSNDGLICWSANRARRLARFVAVDATLQKLKRCREQITPSLGRSCAAFVDLRGWKFFGAARLSDHATERFGRTSRWVRDLAAIGRGLRELPGFESALTGNLQNGLDGLTSHKPLGRITAARLARVATPQSLSAWLALARKLDARQFARAVGKAREAGSDFPLASDSGETGSARRSGDDNANGKASDRPETAPADPNAKDRDNAHWDDDDSSDVQVQVFVPGPLQAGFEDVLELHRAVSGGQVPVRDFVEALVAEALSSSVPADVDCHRLRTGPSRAEVERRMANLAGGWAWLDDAVARPRSGRPRKPSKAERRLEDECGGLVQDALQTCDRLRTIAEHAGFGKADDLQRQIQSLLHLDDAIERSIGRLLGWLSRRRTWAEHLFNGVGHYAEERLGMNRRDAQLRAATVNSLSRFPLLRAAYDRGDLALEATAVVLRILHPGPVDRALESVWLEHAMRVSVKRLKDESRMSTRAWLETFDPRPAMPADDESWLRSLALFPGTTRRRLRRIVEDARPGHRQADCGITSTFRLPAELADRFMGAIEDRRQRAVAGLDCAPAATRLAKLFSGRGRPAPTWVGLLALLEEYVDTWDVSESMPKRRFAKIYAQWGWRCAAPGCTARCWIEAHHLRYLSRGGPLLALWNLVALCRFHHRQGEHGLLASCRGKAPLDIVWRLGHPRVGRWFANEAALRHGMMSSRLGAA